MAANLKKPKKVESSLFPTTTANTLDLRPNGGILPET
jgi:hypothetical protein